MNFFGLGKKKEKREMTPEEVYDFVAQALSFGAISQNSTSRSLSAVYRAVELISDSIAVLPIRIRNIDSIHSEDITNHPIHYAFNNMFMTKYTFMKMLIENVLLNGNGYAYIVRENGKVVGLRYLTTGEVTVNWNKEKQTLWYKVSTIPNKVYPQDIIHLVKNTNDGVLGISVLSYAKRSIKLANATENQAEKFFQSGCNLSGILTVEGQLSQKQRQDIHSSWNQAYTDGGSGLAVLQGNMNYQPVTVNAADAQMLESRQFNVQDIARFFGISPALLGDTSSSSLSTIEAIQNDFLVHTLQPYIEMIECEFNRKLIDEDGLVLKLDETYLLRTDKTAEAQYYSTLLDKGVFCINEVRQALGYSKVDGGDAHTIAYSNPADNDIKNTEKDNPDNNNEEK